MTLARAGLRDAMVVRRRPPHHRVGSSNRVLQIDWAFVRGPIQIDAGLVPKRIHAWIVIHYRSTSFSLVRLTFRAISVELVLTSFNICRNRVSVLRSPLAGVCFTPRNLHSLNDFMYRRCESRLWHLPCLCHNSTLIQGKQHRVSVVFEGTKTMEWTAPKFEEVALNCEINSYASAAL